MPNSGDDAGGRTFDPQPATRGDPDRDHREWASKYGLRPRGPYRQCSLTGKDFPMLVLSRKPSEKIWIECPDGQRVEVIALPSQGNQVRIGIQAPRAYRVTRPELMAEYDAQGRFLPCGTL